MHKAVLSILVAGAAIVGSSPAAAQDYSGRPENGRGYGYDSSGRPDNGRGFGYGFGYGYGQVRELQQRIDDIRRQIARLDRRDVIGGRSADRLYGEANGIERRLHERARRGGLDPREAGEIQYRLQRLEQRVQFAGNERWERRPDRW